MGSRQRHCASWLPEQKEPVCSPAAEGTSLIITHLAAFPHLSAATTLARLSPLCTYRWEAKDKVLSLPLTQRSPLFLQTAVT